MILTVPNYYAAPRILERDRCTYDDRKAIKDVDGVPTPWIQRRESRVITWHVDCNPVSFPEGLDTATLLEIDDAGIMQASQELQYSGAIAASGQTVTNTIFINGGDAVIDEAERVFPGDGTCRVTVTAKVVGDWVWAYEDTETEP